MAINFDYTSLYPASIKDLTDSNSSDILKELLEKRINNRKMEDRLKKIEELLHEPQVDQKIH